MDDLTPSKPYCSHPVNAPGFGNHDRYFDTASEALIDAKFRSGQTGLLVAVSTDARNWVECRAGKITKVRQWADMYLGEPSEAYVWLMRIVQEFARNG